MFLHGGNSVVMNGFVNVVNIISKRPGFGRIQFKFLEIERITVMKMKLCLLVVACAFLLAPCFIAESLAVTCYCDENPINVPVSTYWTGGGTPLTSLGANTCYSLYGWVCGKGACSSYPTWNAAYGDMPDMDVTQLCSAISQFGDNPTQCFACTGWTPTTGSTSTGGTGSTSTSGSNITIPKTGTSVSFTKDSVRLVIPKIVSNESSGQSGSLYMRVYAGTYKVAEKLL